MSVLYIRDRNGDFIQIPTIPGKSAYEIAIEKGVFEGTEQEFAEMLIFSNKEILEQITQEDIDNWNSGGNGNVEIDLSDYATKEELNNLEKIETSEIEPTEEDVSIWIDISKNTEIDEIARINDNTIASNTTWSSEKIDNAIKYIDVSDIEVDLSDYVTKEELSTKANIDDVPTKVSDLTNDSGYATEDYVKNEIAQAKLKEEEIDLSDYATKEELNNLEKIETSEIEPTEEDVSIWIDISKDAITQEIARINDDTIAGNTTWSSEKIDNAIKYIDISDIEVDLSGYVTEEELNTKANTSDIPTKVSDLTNDSGYVTKEELNTKANTSDIPTKVSDLTNDSEYATEDYVKNEIAQAKLEGEEIDLSGYITKEEFNNLEKIETSEIEPTEEDVSIWIDTSKDIITQEISRINDDTIADNTTWSSKKIDSIIRQQGEVASIASINNIPTKTSQLVNDSNFISSIPSEYITETELAAEISRIQLQLICALNDIDAKEKSLTKIGKIVANQVTDDAVALSIQEFYDIWEEGVAYPIGRYITHNDILYKVLTEHTSQATWTPDVSPSLFAKVLIDPNGETIPD